MANQACGQNIGYFNEAVYAVAKEGGFNDIVYGNNKNGNFPKYYSAGEGWDACSGLGSPNGTTLIESLQEMKERDYFFTIDAGPNVHLISERPIKEEIQSLCRRLELGVEIWEDCLGTGVSLE